MPQAPNNDLCGAMNPLVTFASEQIKDYTFIFYIIKTSIRTSAYYNQMTTITKGSLLTYKYTSKGHSIKLKYPAFTI